MKLPLKMLFLFCLCLLLEAKGTVQVSEEAVYSAPVQIGAINDAALSEISGLAPSRTGKGLWWVHNDSGDRPRLYVINSSGKLLGRFTVKGARNRDWEDLASGPGRDGKPALYIADIGDNDRRRDDLTIYRVKEPDLSKGGSKEGETQAAEVFPFQYPDGHHDAEALLVDPKSGRPYLVTKCLLPPCGVYRFPLPMRPKDKVTLEKVTGAGAGRISQLMLVTGAAASPDGHRAIVRTYLGAYEMVRTGQGSFESLFDVLPISVTLAPERQGEAISYAPDGRSLLTVSEKIPAPIYQLRRAGASSGSRRIH